MPADIAPGDVSQTKQTPDFADPVVVFEDVSITFDIKPVLQNISFTVYRGETRIILGPAGGEIAGGKALQARQELIQRCYLCWVLFR